MEHSLRFPNFQKLVRVIVAVPTKPIFQNKTLIELWIKTSESVRELFGGIFTFANLEDDHEFISKEYISIDTGYFGEIKHKITRVYA